MHLNNGLDIPPRNRDILETSIQEILRTYNASMWLAGPGKGEGNYVDSLGFVSAATANSLVGYADDAGVMGRAENWIINSEFVGADAVTPPSIWTGFTTTLGVVFSYVGGGEDEFGRYIDIRVLGTASGNAFPVLHAVPVFSTIAIKPGEIISVGGFHQVIAGSTAGMSVICPRVQVLTGAGGYVEEIAAIPILPTTERTYASGSRVVAGATAVHARPFYQFNVTNGATVDCTVRIWKIQANRGRLNPYTPTFGTMITKPADTIPAYQATTGFKPLLTGSAYNYMWNAKKPSAWLNYGVDKKEITYSDTYGELQCVTESGGTEVHYVAWSMGNTPNSTTITVSAVFRLLGGLTTIGIQGVKNDGITSWSATYDAVTKQVIQAVAIISSSIEDLPEGMKRITATFDSGVGAVNPYVVLRTSHIARAPISGYGFLAGCASAVIGSTPPSVASILNTSVSAGGWLDTVPYSWKFDGVDDRLAVSKPTIPDGAVSHFRIIALKMPPTAPGTNQVAISGASAVASVRLAHLTLLSGGFNIDGRWVDGAGATAIPTNHTRAANEKLVVRLSHAAGTYTLASKGNIGAAQSTSITPAALAAYSATGERIGCSYATGVDNAFSSWEIYGAISGNGAPSAGELLAMENFLAGHAGFTPLP